MTFAQGLNFPNAIARAGQRPAADLENPPVPDSSFFGRIVLADGAVDGCAATLELHGDYSGAGLRVNADGCFAANPLRNYHWDMIFIVSLARSKRRQLDFR